MYARKIGLFKNEIEMINVMKDNIKINLKTSASGLEEAFCHSLMPKIEKSNLDLAQKPTYCKNLPLCFLNT